MSDIDNTDDPSIEPPAAESGGDDDFDAPNVDETGAEDADQEAEASGSEFGAEMVALKAEIEKRLTESCKICDAEGAAVQQLDDSNFVGVGLTYPDAEDLQRGAPGLPGEPAITVFTMEPTSDENVLAEIASIAGTQALSTLPIVQVPTGSIDAQPHRFRIRPAPGGVSVGHFRVTAGTFGCLVRGTSSPRDRRLMVLSNNHVLANSNNARIGDCISQPGNADGGRCPADQIAVLESFRPINFGGGVNFVDCATGWAWPDRVRKELVYLSGGQRRFFRIGASPINPRVGMTVGKSGRTTQLTQGRVTAVNVTVNVNFGGGRVAQFRDQFAVRAGRGNFSAGGDSGSAVWEWARGVRPVGLLFAGGGGTTFCNRMTRVLADRRVRIVS